MLGWSGSGSKLWVGGRTNWDQFVRAAVLSFPNLVVSRPWRCIPCVVMMNSGWNTTSDSEAGGEGMGGGWVVSGSAGII